MCICIFECTCVWLAQLSLIIKKKEKKKRQRDLLGFWLFDVYWLIYGDSHNRKLFLDINTAESGLVIGSEFNRINNSEINLFCFPVLPLIYTYVLYTSTPYVDLHFPVHLHLTLATAILFKLQSLGTPTTNTELLVTCGHWPYGQCSGPCQSQSFVNRSSYMK